MKTLHSLSTISVKVNTPDGTLFVHVVEDEVTHKPIQVLLNIGKNGYSLNAWASALAQTITLALRSGASLHDIIKEISNITTGDRQRDTRNGVRSGPEGVAAGLLRYLGRNNGSEEDEDERVEKFRPARFRHLE